MNKEFEYVGNTGQLLEVKNYRFEGGFADQVRATDIVNQTGLSFTVVADRCMDISGIRYKGINISYMNPCGVVSPKYYDRCGTEWLRSFTAGFMTTCGLDNIGSPCNVKGQELGLHGRISNVPAEGYNVKCIQEGKEFEAVICGEMPQNVMFGDKLKLKRVIRTFQKQNRIEIMEEICNTGYEEQEYMILYHCNLGYPFLSPESEIYIDSESVNPRNQHSSEYLKEWYRIPEPDNLEEMCYYHKMRNKAGLSIAGVFQPIYDFGMIISYENHILDHFTMWKNMKKGEYVLGLEPGSNYVEGKEIESKRDVIKKLLPQEQVNYKLIVEFYDGKDKFLSALEKNKT